jgi:hypothetical protein
MRNYLVIGPVRIRVSSRHLAPWGFARVAVGGLSLLSRTNTGHLMLASYHPAWSHTWRWAVQIMKGGKDRPWIDRAKHRSGQRHDYYRLPLGWQIMVSQQNYMPKKAKAAT